MKTILRVGSIGLYLGGGGNKNKFLINHFLYTLKKKLKCFSLNRLIIYLIKTTLKKYDRSSTKITKGFFLC